MKLQKFLKKDIQEAFNLDQELKKYVEGTTLFYLQTGRISKIIRDNKYYLALDEECKTFNQYIATLGISQGHIYNAIRIYEKWVIEYGYSVDDLAEVPYSKLLMINSVATPENKDEMLAQAKTLSRSDLKYNLKEKQGEVEECFLAKINFAIVCDKYQNGICTLKNEPCKQEQKILNIMNNKEIKER